MKEPVDRGSLAALVALVVLVVVSPWLMGGAPRWAFRGLMLAALSASMFAIGCQALKGRLTLPTRFYLPLYGLVALGTAQLLPLPPALHALLAPGSAAVWHPPEPLAAAVLGSGWRPISVHPGATIEWLAWAIGLTTLSAFAGPSLQDQRLAKRASFAVILGGALVAIYGIVARSLFGPLLFGRFEVPTVSPFGPFVSKNHFAGYVEMVALLALGGAMGLMDEERRGPGPLSWVSSSRAGGIVALLGVSAALTLAIPVSQSRGGVLSLTVGVAALLFLGLRRRERSGLSKAASIGAGLGALALVMAALAILPLEAQRRMATIAAGPQDTSGAFRVGLWRDTLHGIAASPLAGQGLGGFQDALPRFKTKAGELRIEHAENDYLEFLLEGGIIAALALLAFVWSMFDLVPKATDHRGFERGLRVGGIAAAVALAAHSLMDFNLHIPASASLAFFLLTVLSPRVAPHALDGPRARTVGLSAVVCLALVVWWVPSLSSPASAFEIAGGGGLRMQQSEDRLRIHLQQRPADAEAWAWLAWLRAGAGARSEAVPLATYAADLDPTRLALRHFAESLARHQP